MIWLSVKVFFSARWRDATAGFSAAVTIVAQSVTPANIAATNRKVRSI